jgi:hypothetical protein
MNSVAHCKLCKEEIKKDAIVCLHCNNYQNWKRYLNFSSILFSLLIAAFTVIGFTYPYLKEKLQPLKTEIKATLMGTTSEYLYLLVSNTGNRPGSIKDIYITELGVSKKIKRADKRLRFQALSLKEFQVIEPQESKIVRFLFKGPLFFPEYSDDPRLNQYKSVCTLRINTVAFDGSLVKEKEILYACIPQTLRKQWVSEAAEVNLLSGGEFSDYDSIRKHRPDLYKLIVEYQEKYPPPPPSPDDLF